MSKSCKLYPFDESGNRSVLWTSLNQDLGKENRGITNLLYVLSKTQAFRDKVGHDPDPITGEYTEDEVWKVLKGADRKAALGGTDDILRNLGEIDNTGHRKIRSYEETAKKAMEINDNEKYNDIYVAYVQGTNGEYWVTMEVKTASNQVRAGVLKQRKRLFNIATSAMDRAHLNWQGVSTSVFDVNSSQTFELLKTMERASIYKLETLSVKDFQLLIEMNNQEDNPAYNQIQRLLQITDKNSAKLAQIAFDHFNGESTLTATQASLLNAALKNMRKFGGLKIAELKNELDKEKKLFQESSGEYKVQTSLKELYKKYAINEEEMDNVKNHLDSIRDLIKRQIFNLRNDIDALEAKNASGEVIQKYQEKKFELEKMYTNAQFKQGTVTYLKEATQDIQNMQVLWASVGEEESTDPKERAREKCRIAMLQKNVLDKHLELMQALCTKEMPFFDDMTKEDVEEITTEAKKILDTLLKIQTQYNDFLKVAIREEVEAYLPKGEGRNAVEGVLELADKDSNFQSSWLYSGLQGTDAYVSFAASRLRAAEEEKVEKLFDLQTRMDRAHHLLKDNNTEFMYEEQSLNDMKLDVQDFLERSELNEVTKDKYVKEITDIIDDTKNRSKALRKIAKIAKRSNLSSLERQTLGALAKRLFATPYRIISTVDFAAYRRALNAYRRQLDKENLDVEDYRKKIQEWQDENLVDDTVFGTSGKIPDPEKYKKKLPKLRDDQLAYYKEMIKINGELKELIPEGKRDLLLPPQKRRGLGERVTKVRGWRSLRNVFRSVGDQFAVREDDEFNLADRDVPTTASGEERLDIPVRYIRALQNQQELSKDFTGAMQALAVEALNYAAMKKVEDEILALKAYSQQRKMKEEVKGKTKATLERFGRNVMRRAARKNTPNSQKLLDDFIKVHMYRVPLNGVKVNKFVRGLLSYVSVKALALNVTGSIANYVQLLVQQVIEASGGEHFNFKDFLWAMKDIRNIPQLLGTTRDNYSTTTKGDLTVMARFFNLYQEKSYAAKGAFYGNILGRIISNTEAVMGYSMGEHLGRLMTMKSMMHHVKVKNGDDKKSNLFEIFLDSIVTEEGNKSIDFDKFKGWTLEDGTEITKEWLLNTFKPRLYWESQNIGGSMNEEDKGLIHQYMWGKALMLFKQWMVRLYSNRFRRPYYDAMLGEMNGGIYTTTALKIAKNFKKNWQDRLRAICAKRGMSIEEAKKRDVVFQAMGAAINSFIKIMFLRKSADLSKRERINLKKVWGEILLTMGFFITKGMLGIPDDDDNYAERMFKYQINRGYMDESALNPVTAFNFVNNSIKLVRDPYAAAREVENARYILDVWSIGEPVGKRKKKARILPAVFNSDKYLNNLYFKVLPFISDYDKVATFTENEDAFNIFDTSGFAPWLYN